MLFKRGYEDLIFSLSARNSAILNFYHSHIYKPQKGTLACFYNKLSKNLPHIYVIQVGANDGVSFDNLYFTVTEQRWSGIVIEPLPKHFVKLEKNYKNYKNVLPVNSAIHATKKEAKIYSVNEVALDKYPEWIDGCTSMSREHLIRAGVLSDDIIESIVHCSPLMRVVEAHNMYDADYIQIDTEGFDAEIVKQIDFSKLKPLVIKFEWMHLSAKEKIEMRELLLFNKYELEIDGDGQDCCAWLHKYISP